MTFSLKFFSELILLDNWYFLIFKFLSHNYDFLIILIFFPSYSYLWLGVCQKKKILMWRKWASIQIKLAFKISIQIKY